MRVLDLDTVRASLPGYIPGGRGGAVRDSRDVVDDGLEPPRRVEQKPWAHNHTSPTYPVD